MSRYGSSGGGNEVIVIAVDAPDPDNPALVVYVAKKIKALRRLGIEVAGVLLTGRPVGPPYDAKGRPIPGQHNEAESRRIQQLDAQRFYAHLRRAGITDVLVYDGGIAHETPIPDGIHFPSEEFGDIQNDIRPNDQLRPLSDLIRRIGARNTHWIVGGPMTGVALALFNYPQLQEHTSSLTAMYGAMEGINLMNAEQFNFMVDRQAGKYVFETLSRKGARIVLVPTNTTKDSRLALDDGLLDEMFGESREGKILKDINRKWHEKVLVPANQGHYAHDLAAGMAFMQEKRLAPQIFQFARARVGFAEREGKLRMFIEQVNPTGEREGPISFRMRGGESDVWVDLALDPDQNAYFEDARQTFQG